MTDGPAMPEPAAAAPTPVSGTGAGGPWWRQRNAILALAGLVIVIVVIVVATSGGSSNGWTPALQAQTLRACESQSNVSSQGCQCAVQWIVAHLTPSQAATGSEALGRALAGQVLTACPSLLGGGG